MTEATEQAPKRRGGWPRGKPRLKAPAGASPVTLGQLKQAEQRTRPLWNASDLAKFAAPDDVVFDDGQVDGLRVDDAIVHALLRDGLVLQWGTHSIYGQPQNLSNYQRSGWHVVQRGDLGGALDHLADDASNASITKGACVLLVRSATLHEKAKARERAAANRPLEVQKEIGAQGLNVPGGDHPTATRGNKISKTMERIEVPE